MVQRPDAIGCAALGRNMKAQTTMHVERPLRAGERIGDDRFFHMQYADIMRDPMDVMRRIHDWAGDPLTDETEAP